MISIILLLVKSLGSHAICFHRLCNQVCVVAFGVGGSGEVGGRKFSFPDFAARGSPFCRGAGLCEEAPGAAGGGRVGGLSLLTCDAGGALVVLLVQTETVTGYCDARGWGCSTSTGDAGEGWGCCTSSGDAGEGWGCCTSSSDTSFFIGDGGSWRQEFLAICVAPPGGSNKTPTDTGFRSQGGFSTHSVSTHPPSSP